MLKKYLFIATSVVLTHLVSMSGHADEAADAIVPPEIGFVDSRGVNLISQQPVVSQELLSIGGDMGMSYQMTNSGLTFTTKPWADNQIGGISLYGVGRYHQHSEANYRVTVDGATYNFFYKNGVFSPMLEDGEALTSTAQGYTLVLRDGTEAYLDKNINYRIFNKGTVTKIVYPNGLEKNYFYKRFTTSRGAEDRIQSVSQSNGLKLKYEYEKSNCNSSSSATDVEKCFFPVRIKGINSAYDYCDNLADSCAVSRDLPTATFSWTAGSWTSGDLTLTVTDDVGNSTEYTVGEDGTGGNITPIKLKRVKSENSPPTSYEYIRLVTVGSYIPPFAGAGSYSPDTYVVKATKGNADWSYSRTQYSAGDGGFSVSSTGPADNAFINLGGTWTTPVKFQKDGNTFHYDALHYTGRLTKVVRVSVGETTEYHYDNRGNVTSSVRKADGLPDSVKTVNYDAQCSNAVKCNKPNWIEDAEGNRSDYEYYSSGPVGFLKKITKPANQSGVRPQTRYFYSQRVAWVKNSSGQFVQGPPIWVLTKESFCLNGNASGNGCENANDEVVTEYEYGPNAGPNNLFLRGKVVTANGETSRTCYSYDVYGNKVSEIMPNANLPSCSQ